MSHLCSCCSLQPPTLRYNSPLCQSCEDKFVPGNLCCDFCSINRPTQLCTCDFPLPMLCSACIDKHREKLIDGSHSAAPLFVRGVIKSREHRLWWSQRAVKIEYVTGKLRECTNGKIANAKKEIDDQASVLKSFIDAYTLSLQSLLDSYILHTNSLIARLAYLKFDFWHRSDNLFESVIIEDSNHHLDYECFKYRFDEGNLAFVPNFFQCQFIIPSAAPALEPQAIVPKNRISQRMDYSTEAMKDPNSHSLPPASRPSRMSELPACPLAAPQVPPSAQVAAASAASTPQKCAYCNQKIVETSQSIFLSCGHSFHDRECFFSHLRVLSHNFTINYNISCPLCHTFEDGALLIKSNYGNEEFLQRIERVKQTVCYVCGEENVVIKWSCQHRLCEKHKIVTYCSICEKIGEMERRAS